MSLTTIPLPYGLRDVKISVLASDGTPGSPIDLPNARTFSFSAAEETSELRGDDGLVAVHGQGEQVAFELEGGGISFEAVKGLYGGTITETGTTPAQKKSFKKNKDDQRPYVQVEGQAISDSGGDVHCTLFRAKCTGELTGEMADQAFWLTGAKGTALPDSSTGDIYEFVQNESITAIS